MSDIECYQCRSDSYCLYNDGEWICKRCFLDAGHDYDDWNDRCDQAARERQQRRNEQAFGEYNNYVPVSRNKIKICKFGCNTKLYWNDRLETKNKFVEVETEKPHTGFRCSLAKANIIKEIKRKENE